MKKSFCLLLVSFVLFGGCATLNYSGDLEVVSPEPVWQTGYARVQMLQPTLAWRDVSRDRNPNSTYDLVVYEAVWGEFAPEIGSLIRRRILIPREQVYYREGIKGTSHTLEEKLGPDAYYCWSVRRREDTNAAPWATWSAKGLVGSQQKFFWAFKTPER